MKHFVIATHGYFSRELIQSASLIMGNGPDILYLCMCETTTGDEIRGQLRKKLEDCAPEDQVIIMADVLGGSICTLCTEFLSDSRVHVLAGVNMPMLLTVLGMYAFLDTEALIEEAVRSGREGICYVNRIQTKKEEELPL